MMKIIFILIITFDRIEVKRDKKNDLQDIVRFYLGDKNINNYLCKQI